MKVGILGSGLMGSKLGTIFARAGHEVVFSYARSKAKLERLAHEAGGNARAGTLIVARCFECKLRTSPGSKIGYFMICCRSRRTP